MTAPGMTALRPAALLLGLCACNEYVVNPEPKVPPAEPPGRELDAQGLPPDWADCFAGYWGRYSNLTVDHPQVEPDTGLGELDPELLDWWEEPDFERFDPSLEFGEAWWPVDQGLQSDPAYFAVQWNAWVRSRDRSSFEILVAATGDLWVWLGDDLIVEQVGAGDFEPLRLEIDAGAGQFPLEIRTAHRQGEASGLRFRVLTEDVSVCMPDYSETE